MRTIIEVPNKVIKELDRVVERQKKSRAAVIREAISLYLDQQEPSSPEAAFGLWKDRKIDGLNYQAEARSDWD